MSEAFRALEVLLEERRIFDKPDMGERVGGIFSNAKLYGIARELLAEATPYFWAREQCAMIATLAPSVPLTWTPAADCFETPAGFFLFAEPFALAPAWPPLSALGWKWIDQKMLFLLYFVGERRALPAPLNVLRWPAQDSLGEYLDRVQATATMISGQPIRDPEIRTDFLRVTRVAAAAFAFLEQRILVRQSPTLPRAVRRRLPAAARDTLVHVVTLRRTEAIPHLGAEESPIAWSCRWIVRGHWREQWYPRLNRHRPIWILPHEKGPEDRPLRMPGARVFAVTR